MSVSLDKLKQKKDSHLISNTGEILLMESRLNKMKNLVHMEVDLRKNKDEFNKICKEIQEAQQQLKSKKREKINEKLMQIQTRQEERAIRNKESNQTLQKIKEDHRERRKRMQSLVNEYKRQYDFVYKKRLIQRRENARFNLQDISEHQKQYLRSVRKYSNRIKTQSLQKSRQRYTRQQQSFEFSTREEKEQSLLKREKIMELVNRRIEYGNKAQKQAIKVKIPHSLLEKIKVDSNKSGYDKNIDAYNHQKQRYKKPKLDTNFNGDIQQKKHKQILKIATQQSPTANKLTRLRHIVDGFNQQYVNGQVDALDMMCSASLARANLLLKQS